MNEETHQKLMKIKRSFRLLMSGPTSQSMTQKGLGYKINWGVPFIELKKMALEYGKDYELAIELWKEDIRECKILATLIMPAEKMLPEITDIWMEQVKSQEWQRCWHSIFCSMWIMLLPLPMNGLPQTRRFMR